MRNELIECEIKPGAMCWYDADKKLSIIHIPKCGTNSIKKAVPDSFKFIPLEYILGVKYCAIIRHPLGRWVSGMATNFSNRIHNGHTTYEKVMAMLDEPEAWEYMLKVCAFEVHTKPQHLFWEPIKGKIRLFDAENRNPFYDYLANHGLEIEDLHQHNVRNFDKNHYHYLIWSRIDLVVSNNKKYQEKINCYYKKDRMNYVKIRAKTN